MLDLSGSEGRDEGGGRAGAGMRGSAQGDVMGEGEPEQQQLQGKEGGQRQQVSGVNLSSPAMPSRDVGPGDESNTPSRAEGEEAGQPRQLQKQQQQQQQGEGQGRVPEQEQQGQQGQQQQQQQQHGQEPPAYSMQGGEHPVSPTSPSQKSHSTSILPEDHAAGETGWWVHVE